MNSLNCFVKWTTGWVVISLITKPGLLYAANLSTNMTEEELWIDGSTLWIAISFLCALFALYVTMRSSKQPAVPKVCKTVSMNSAAENVRTATDDYDTQLEEQMIYEGCPNYDR